MGVEPTETALAGQKPHHGHGVAPEQLHLGAHVDLAVVGGDHQDGARGQFSDQVGHQPVDGPQLGIVEVAEPVPWATLSMPS